MKKRLIPILFSVFLLSLLVACGPSAEEQAQAAQYKEWSAQADEIEPLLSEALSFSGVVLYEADVSVSNTSGEIVSSVKVKNTDESFQNFGTIVSLVYDKYTDLIAEYEDYTFGKITFFYSAEDESSILTYSVDSSSDGTFVENRNEKFTLKLTPDEVFERLQDTLNYIS